MARAPFVGREQELAALRGPLQAALDGGSSSAVVVVGEPGSGKSRLLHEPGLSGERVEASGFEPAAAVPLAAAGPLLRRLFDVPEHGPPLEAAVLQPGRETRQLGIFEAAQRALTELGALLVIVDDVQWADQATLALLGYLLRGSHHGLAVVAAGRPDPRTHGFVDDAVRALGDRAAALDLTPLSRDEGVALARILDPSLQEAEAEERWRRSQGSPFWLELLNAGATADRGLGAVITERLRGVPADAVEALAALLVSARPLPAADLAAVLEWPEDRVNAACAALVGRGLVVPDPGGFRIAHDLIRESATPQIPATSAHRLNDRLAAWMTETANGAPGMLLEAMDHRAAAGRPYGDLAVAVARSPRRRLVGVDGLRRLARAADALPSAEGLELNMAVAEIGTELGEDEEAAFRWRTVLTATDDPRLRAHAALEGSRAALRLRRADEARDLLATSRAAGPDPGLEIETDVQEAAILRWLDRRPEEAWEIGRRAVEAARRLPRSDPARAGALARALDGALDAARLGSDFTSMLGLARELQEAVTGVDDAAALRAAFWEGFALTSLLRTKEGARRLEWAVQEARRRVLPDLSLEFEWFSMLLEIAFGRLSEARDTAVQGAALRRRAGGIGPSFTAWPHVVELSTGRWREAAEALKAEIRVEEDPHYRILPGQFLILALCRFDPGGPVDDLLEETRRAAEEGGCSRCRAEFLMRGAAALAFLGQVERARGWVEESAAGPGTLSPLGLLYRRQAEASVGLAAGDQDAAADLQAVADQSDAVGRPMEAVWMRLDLGRLLIETDPSLAADAFRRAGATAESLGAVNEAAAAQRGLRGLGVRTWRRGPAPRGEDVLARLTQREREVARLVAGGATNPEIAAAMFLSRKTIERHVSNVLAKVGARNRAELAALLGNEGAPR